jgi:hypothetical protein
MNAAAPPGRVHQVGDRGLDALVSVRDDELDAAQAAPPELAQKLGPERFGLRGANVDAEHLAPAVRVHPDRHDHRDRNDAVVAARLHIGRVDPDIGPIAFKRPIEESFDPRVDLLAQPADLALGNAGPSHRPDQVVDRAGRDAVAIGFLDHRGQRLLRHPPRPRVQSPGVGKYEPLLSLGMRSSTAPARVSQSWSR